MIPEGLTRDEKIVLMNQLAEELGYQSIEKNILNNLIEGTQVLIERDKMVNEVLEEAKKLTGGFDRIEELMNENKTLSEITQAFSEKNKLVIK